MVKMKKLLTVNIRGCDISPSAIFWLRAERPRLQVCRCCCAVLCCAAAVLCYAVLCCAVLCCPVLCCPVLCCPVLTCPVLSCVVLSSGMLLLLLSCVV